MSRLHRISSLAAAVSLGWALPAQAQSADGAETLRAELAQMRQQMEAMAARMLRSSWACSGVASVESIAWAQSNSGGIVGPLY